MNLKSAMKKVSAFVNKKGMVKEKPYELKYHVLKIRSGEILESGDCNQLDFSQFHLINLKKRPDFSHFKHAQGFINDKDYHSAIKNIVHSTQTPSVIAY